MNHEVTLVEKRADILSHYAHPWVYSKGMTRRPDLPPGSLVRVVSEQKRTHLGWAFYHPKNSICLRMITTRRKIPGEGFWRDKIRTAIQLRKRILRPDGETNCYRLIHGENDGFPGLTVDVFGPLAVIQIVSAGFEGLRQELAQWLIELADVQAVFEKSDTMARKQEGLGPRSGFILGDMALPLTIRERGLEFLVSPAGGHKTGFYLDQRPQRAWVERQAMGARVLDLFAYTGGFSVSALRGGAASVCAVDSSESALATAQRHVAINGLPEDRFQAKMEDIFEWLKMDAKETWDIIILDPPPMAKSRAAVDKALRAYRTLNRHSAERVAPGGVLLSFSCTGLVTTEDFAHSLFLGLRDSGRSAVTIEQFSAGADHPVSPFFPEGRYLKGYALYFSG